MLCDQQVLDGGHVFKQAYVLEGTHDALAGDFMTRQAFNRLTIKQDAASRRLVEAGQAVEHGCFASPVRADH